MYSRFIIVKKYLHYWLTSSNGSGHGIHSPFVYDFIKQVLKNNKKQPAYDSIENIRRNLLNDSSIIEVEDFGAGSTLIKNKKRRVSQIAASSLKSKKYAQLLGRIVQYYKPASLIELGTSFGITTSYLASANSNATITTFEGASAIAAVAEKNFKALAIDNVQLITGDFSIKLPAFLENQQKIDFAFIDGNHRKAPTIQYFDMLLKSSHESSMMIFDDIHWSEEMESAWNDIKNHPAVTLTINLFFIGLVFFKKDFKVKQHFTIRF